MHRPGPISRIADALIAGLVANDKNLDTKRPLAGFHLGLKRGQWGATQKDLPDAHMHLCKHTVQVC